MTFHDLLVAQRGPSFPETVLGLRTVGIDPGETTGICVFEGIQLLHSDQLPTGEVPKGAARITSFLLSWKCNMAVMEEYRVYAWKTRQHANASLHTPRLIGAMEYILSLHGVYLITQGAGEGKGFCTDEKLKEWGFYQTGRRHANDAIRHVCHALLFQKGLPL